MWVRLDDSAPHHPKLVRAGSDAFTLWVSGIAYCNRLKTDGVIEKPMVALLTPMLQGARLRKAVEALCSNGGASGRHSWIDDGEHYIVHDIARYQPSKLAIEAENAAARERMQKAREAKRKTSEPQSVPANGSGERIVRTEEGNASSTCPPRLATTDKKQERATPSPGDIRQVFDAWVASLPDTARRQLNDKRRKCIQVALKSFPVGELCEAAQGWRFDPWEERPLHNDLPQLFRNVEKFRDLYRNGPPGRKRAAAFGGLTQPCSPEQAAADTEAMRREFGLPEESKD